MEDQLLDILSNPIIISIMLIIGVQAILIEISHPGGWIIGLIGVFFLGVALYGMTLISVNWLGLALIALAFVLFVLEAKTPTFGAMAISGVLAMLAGLWVVFNMSNSPSAVALSLPAAALISVASGAFFIFVAGKAFQAQGAPSKTGAEGLVGQTGPVRDSIRSKFDKPPYKGMVLILGELWQAVADEPIDEDEMVTVTAVDGLAVRVKKIAG